MKKKGKVKEGVYGAMIPGCTSPKTTILFSNLSKSTPFHRSSNADLPYLSQLITNSFIFDKLCQLFFFPINSSLQAE